MKLKIHSLSIRFLLRFSLLVILPVFTFTFVSSMSYSRYQRDLSRVQMQEMVNQMADNLNDEIASVSILSSALIHSESFHRVCDSYSSAESPSDIYLQSEAMDLELSNLFLYTSKMGILFVYIRDKPVFLFRNFPMTRTLPSVPEPADAMDRMIAQTPGSIQISDDFFLYQSADGSPDEREPMLTLAIKPDIRQIGSSIEKVIFAYRIQLFEKIYNTDSQQQFSYVTNGRGKLLLTACNDPRPGEIPVSGPQTTKRWLVLSSSIKNTGWILYHVIDLQSFLEPFHIIQRFSLMIFVLLFIFFIVYTVLFLQSMISPLNILIEKMQLVEEGDYTVSVPEPGEKELNHLFHSFNRMIGRVKGLTELKSRTDREKGLLELQALQYQINPHFIANTLNSIRLMAVVKKNDNIKNMTASLMKIINDSFRGDGNRNTLLDEKNALSSYVHIMKVRFSTPIELRFSVPRDLKESLILKMVLQPIVENSIVHGFARKKGKGIILIKAEKEENHLYLRICDNGCGCSISAGLLPEKPDKGEASTLTRVGIRNVDRRIKLNYGASYGLEMHSRPDLYTRVDIRLPLIIAGEMDGEI